MKRFHRRTAIESIVGCLMDDHCLKSNVKVLSQPYFIYFRQNMMF